MIELIAAGIFFLMLSIILIYRVAKGPSDADRIVALKSTGTLITAALIAFSVYSGRSIYLDIAIVFALLGFAGVLLILRYMEEKQ